MPRNPVLTNQAFEQALQGAGRAVQPMTLQGTINKTFFLLLLCVLGAMCTWTNYQAWGAFMWPIAIGALVVGLLASFKRTWAPILAPVYAILEGLLLGVVSGVYNAASNGIVFNAVAITLLVFFVMLFIYRAKIIRVTRGFQIALVSATAAIALLYIGSWILSLFGVSTAYLTSSSPLSIGISVVVCLVAAFNFLLDFEFINQMTTQVVAPKYMEWYAAFGLMVTLIWLYIEILKLLGKTNRR